MSTPRVLDGYLGSSGCGYEVAVSHAAKGRRVFPFKLVPRPAGGFDKKPCVRWLDEATTDEQVLTGWWRRWPDAYAGWRLPGGSVVADIDDRDAFLATGLVLPPAPWQATPSGGEHRLFLAADADQTVKKVPGLDTRVGGKGFVGLYSVDAFEGDPPPAPAWLVNTSGRHKGTPSLTIARSPALVAIETGQLMIRRGERDNSLASIAGSLISRGGSAESTAFALELLNAAGAIEQPTADRLTDFRRIAYSVARTAEGTTRAGATPLRFYTPAELASITLPAPDWIAGPGLLALGAITEIDGKIKAAGKTTLILHMIRAILDGADFLGQRTRQAQVVYVTEQSRQTFSDGLRRLGLDKRGAELRILFREDIGPTQWPDVVAATRQDGYEVVGFDTIGKLAGIREENSAGEWSSAMSPLQDLAADGRAVIIARHDRKSGGEVGDSGRGSSQASGDVDIILGLRRPEGHQPSNRRVVESLSRYPDTPERIVVELTDHGYVLLGTNEAVALSDALGFVSAAIAAEYRQTSGGLSMKALVELGRERQPVVKRTTIQAALDRMERLGEIVRAGRGVASDPYVYSPANRGSAESAETRNIYGRQTLDPSV